MLKITVKVDGMMCGMCEAHVNGAVRKAFSVKNVTSSHRKGETVILSESDIDETELRSVIRGTGYEVKAVLKEPYEKRGFFTHPTKQQRAYVGDWYSSIGKLR